MQVAQLWRFPVKSLQGDQVDSVRVDGEGMEGDRRLAIFDPSTGFGLTARRVPELLFAKARATDDGEVEITLPDGTVANGDGALSAWLGRPVELRRCTRQGPRHYENPADPEDEGRSRWEPFEGSSGAFHDSPGAMISLVSTTTTASWPLSRFRTNVILRGSDEDACVGKRLAIGDVIVDVGMRIERCVMVTRPQPGGIERSQCCAPSTASARGASPSGPPWSAKG